LTNRNYICIIIGVIVLVQGGASLESWNFRGYIALPLEEYGRVYFGDSRITADEIECGKFVDAMFSILSIKFGSLKDIPDFVCLCEDYADMQMSKIPKEKATEMFKEFKRILNT